MQPAPAPDGGAPANFAATLLAARAGGSEALGQLLFGSCTYLGVIARARLQDAGRHPADAEDLLQTTVLRALIAFADFRGETEDELHGWMRSILLHVLADDAVQRQHDAVALADDGTLLDMETPSWTVMEGERAEIFDQVLARLALDHRLILQLLRKARGPWRDLGRKLGRSTDAARMLAERALEAFREEATAAEWEVLSAPYRPVRGTGLPRDVGGGTLANEPGRYRELKTVTC